jgi:type II secretory ATPase GspE/PulE/Tfp pilus assembly ATPase PilB-like protein
MSEKMVRTTVVKTTEVTDNRPNSSGGNVSSSGAAASAAASADTSHLRPGQLVDVSRLPVDQAVQRLISHAVDIGASDLFLTSNEEHVAVLVRHLGLIKPLSIVGHDDGRRYLSHIKAAAGMDLTEKRRPSDGRWIFEKEDGDSVDLRINVIPTIYGEDFAVRLLARGSNLFQLENLGMTPQQLQAYKGFLDSPSGLILITGPTGSGKTATMYASLIRLNDGTKKINTIEDPVEYAVGGLRQSQVNPLIDLGFAEMLRSVLRQSPDVIMIGEIRDEETARTAVHAANSGVLVLATIHAPSAPGAIQSMRSLGVQSHFLSTALRGCVSQRLVRTFDMNTRVAFDLGAAADADPFEEVRKWLGPNEGRTLYGPGAAESNQMSGYAGRTGVFEVMPVTRNIRNLISDGKPVREIRARAAEEGMLEFRQAALLKVARGETSTEEVFRVIPAEHLLLED